MTSTKERQIPSRPTRPRGLVPFAVCTSLVLALTASACSSDDTTGAPGPTDAIRTEPDGGADACPTHSYCDGACVNLESDHDHCGNCSSICAADQFCRGARCRTCEEDGLSNCNGQCTDLLSTSTDCGTCGHACTAAEQCRNGNCVNPCAEGQLSCNDTCIDPSVDAQNCGSCGHVCPAGQACNGKACTCADPNLVSCDGTCLDPKTEKTHCGATPGCGFNTGWAGSTCVANGFCSDATCRLCQTWTVGWSVQPAPGELGLLMATADFNQDSKLDIAVAAGETPYLKLYLGNGDATFRAGPSYPLGEGITAIVALDYDGDGKKDLAIGKTLLTAPLDQSYIALFHGNGDGTFGSGATLERQIPVASLGAGDVDDNGRDDIFASNPSTALGDSRIYLSKTGGFVPGANLAPSLVELNSGTGGSRITITDVDKDGHADVALLPMTIFFGNGDGTFGDTWTAPPGLRGSKALVIDDMNGDGSNDLFWRFDGPVNTWQFALGMGNRNWKYPSTLLFGAESNVAYSDVTGDGMRDLVGIGFDATDSIFVRGGRGDGTFVAEEQYGISTTEPMSDHIATSDLDGNGIVDIVTATRYTIMILTGQKSARPECQ